MATPRPSVRRILALMCSLAVGFALLAPLLLGPALTPIVRAFGAHVEHRCACGMVQGTCECPTCARLEVERREARNTPLVRSSCEDDEGLPVLGSLAPCLGGPAGVAIVAPPAVSWGQRWLPDVRSRIPDEPTRPPPKTLFAV